MLSLYAYFDLYGFGSSGRFSTYVRMIRNLFENLQEPLANARVQGAKFFLQHTVAVTFSILTYERSMSVANAPIKEFLTSHSFRKQRMQALIGLHSHTTGLK